MQDSIYTNKILRDENIFISGGGLLSYAAPNFTFSDDIKITCTATNAVYTVSAATVTLNDEEVLYVTLPARSAYANGTLTTSHATFAAFKQERERAAKQTLVPICFIKASNIHSLITPIYSAGSADYVTVDISSDTSLTLNAVNCVDTSAIRNLTLPAGSDGKFVIIQDKTREQYPVIITRSSTDTIVGDTTHVIQGTSWDLTLIFKDGDWRMA